MASNSVRAKEAGLATRLYDVRFEHERSVSRGEWKPRHCACIPNRLGQVVSRGQYRSNLNLDGASTDYGSIAGQQRQQLLSPYYEILVHSPSAVMPPGRDAARQSLQIKETNMSYASAEPGCDGSTHHNASLYCARHDAEQDGLLSRKGTVGRSKASFREKENWFGPRPSHLALLHSSRLPRLAEGSLLFASATVYLRSHSFGFPGNVRSVKENNLSITHSFVVPGIVCMY